MEQIDRLERKIDKLAGYIRGLMRQMAKIEKEIVVYK